MVDAKISHSEESLNEGAPISNQTLKKLACIRLKDIYVIKEN